ncbi:hypothetical protein N9224_00605 [Akkermansiaceae bacterium]|nr:hypothetical protein [Akkermansiaceae bacterium]
MNRILSKFSALFFPFLMAMIATSQATTIWEEDFEGTSLGTTTATNQTITGSTAQPANTATSIVVDSSSDPAAASAFTLASGKFIRLSVGDSDYSSLRSSADPITFPAVSDREPFFFSFDVYIPGSTNLDAPVGRVSPRLESNGAANNGATDDSSEVQAPGQYRITYSGTVGDFKNPSSTGDADSIRPLIILEQKINAADNGTTNDFIYLDNIHLEIGAPPRRPLRRVGNSRL